LPRGTTPLGAALVDDARPLYGDVPTPSSPVTAGTTGPLTCQRVQPPAREGYSTVGQARLSPPRARWSGRNPPTCLRQSHYRAFYHKNRFRRRVRSRSDRHEARRHASDRYRGWPVSAPSRAPV